MEMEILHLGNRANNDSISPTIMEIWDRNILFTDHHINYHIGYIARIVFSKHFYVS